MTWGRRDDQAWHNEKLVALSHEAFRLREVALSFVGSEWPDGDGRLGRERLTSLCRLHNIADPRQAIAELVDATCLDIVADSAPETYRMHDIERYMPPPELSRKRAEAGRKGGVATHAANTKSSKRPASAKQMPSNSRANARALAKHLPSKGSPVPVPVNTTTTPTGSVVGDLPVADPDETLVALFPELTSTAESFVGRYVDHVKLAGAVPDRRLLPRIGQEANRLLDEGHDREAILVALQELARRNEPPARLAYIVGDVERVRAGTPMGRVRPAAIYENPVDARLRAIREGREYDEPENPVDARIRAIREGRDA